MMDFTKMMGSIKEMQEKMKEAQARLEQIEVSGEAGAGLVKITANGKKTITKVEIDSSLFTNDDREMVQDLVVAAVNKAIEAADEKSKEEIRKTASGSLPNIPGFDLSRFM